MEGQIRTLAEVTPHAAGSHHILESEAHQRQAETKLVHSNMTQDLALKITEDEPAQEYTNMPLASKLQGEEQHAGELSQDPHLRDCQEEIIGGAMSESRSGERRRGRSKEEFSAARQFLRIIAPATPRQQAPQSLIPSSAPDRLTLDRISTDQKIESEDQVPLETNTSVGSATERRISDVATMPPSFKRTQCTFEKTSQQNERRNWSVRGSIRP
jgi:hypothetical protein